MPAYTQGLMDLGATVCSARDPACDRCPAQGLCRGREEGTPQRYPVKTRKTRRSAQSLWLLRAHSGDAVWLEKRPSPGVWAGLYCLPVFDSRDELASALPDERRAGLRDSESFLHVLTHKDLHLHPVEVQLPRSDLGRTGGAWFGASDWPGLGLPAPIRKLLCQAQLAVPF
jgi:A/G-specific adenine glycosylase